MTKINLDEPPNLDENQAWTPRELAAMRLFKIPLGLAYATKSDVAE